MSAKILFRKYIIRKDLQVFPERFYIFGDNLERVGSGGQAREMRGEPNAIGVATKRSPGMRHMDFFADREMEIQAVRWDLSKIDEKIAAGHIIVVPGDGIGTGLAELPVRSPIIHQMIRIFFMTRIDGELPW
jgi:hypothetical protein